MDNSRVNVSRWVDIRLATLDPTGPWRPNATRALSRLKTRQARRFRYLWASGLAAAAACIGFLMLLAQPACATPYCAGLMKTGVAPAVKQAAKPAATPTVTPAPVVASIPALPLQNFKESGSPTARITCEIYSDYECPSCAVLFRDVLPLLVTQYVQTGKVKLIHRDFPLQMHPFARLATRYANAAGELGHYDVVVPQLFKTQERWNKSGDIDAQLTEVLPPGVMQKVRQLVKNDAQLDRTVAADMALGQADHLTGTPTVVIVANGKRQVLPAMPPFSLLKAYLDQLLASQ
jgi:protein-disulfide isomerase